MRLDRPIRFVVPGLPKGRTNPFSVKTSDGGSRVIQSHVTLTFEAIVAMAATAAFEGVPVITGGVRIDILAVFPRTGKISKGQPGLVFKVNKPDIDNVTKAILDGLQGRWTDDCLVAIGETAKAYAEMDGQSRTEVVISPLTDTMFLGRPIAVHVEVEKKPRGRSPKAPTTTPGSKDSTLGF